MANQRDVVPGMAEKLKAARLAAGLTGVQLKEFGVYQSALSAYEAGVKVPTVAVLYKLAKAYGVTPADLLPPPEPPPKPVRARVMGKFK